MERCRCSLILGTKIRQQVLPSAYLYPPSRSSQRPRVSVLCCLVSTSGWRYRMVFSMLCCSSCNNWNNYIYQGQGRNMVTILCIKDRKARKAPKSSRDIVRATGAQGRFASKEILAHHREASLHVDNNLLI